MRVALIRPCDSINHRPIDLAHENVALCARLVDCYPSLKRHEGTIGDVIREKHVLQYTGSPSSLTRC
jgi:hypothetical protein